MGPGELRPRLAAVRLEHLLDRAPAGQLDVLETKQPPQFPSGPTQRPSLSPPAGQCVDWSARLGLGERQQLGLGRMMLARPAFAVRRTRSIQAWSTGSNR
jgi:ABC-type uncharacterized transport system fused permease/ATPase subunit